MSLKLWSKLESASDVTSPQLGTGGAEIGSPTYEAAKFNNGILSDINDEGCTFPTVANSLNADKGTIEFWAKLNFAPDHGADHYLFSFKQTISPYGGIRLYFSYVADHFKANTQISIIIEEVDFVWESGDLVHFAIVWDREGNDIGGGKTLALYINGVLKASTVETWDTSDVNANLFISTNRSGDLHSDAVIDNLKTYDTCKTDFSDREDESAGANTAPTAPTSLEVDGKSTPTGANCVTTAPQFTAIFNDPDAGDQSNAIQIQVGSASGLSDMWNSGWLADSTIDGNRCDAKTYAGAALSRGTSYWWRCRFRDDDDAEGEWSSWQKFDICEEGPGGPYPKHRPYKQPYKEPVMEPGK